MEVYQQRVSCEGLQLKYNTMRDASTAQVCRQPPSLIALPLPHAPALTPAMQCGGHPSSPPAPSIVLPPQLTISRAARRWLPRRRLLRRQLLLPRVRPGALPALVRHLSSTAATRGAMPRVAAADARASRPRQYRTLTPLPPVCPRRPPPQLRRIPTGYACTETHLLSWIANTMLSSPGHYWIKVNP